MIAMQDQITSRLAAIVGPAGIIDEPGAMAPYEKEWRERFRGRARVVVRPASTEEVARVVRVCAEMGVGVVPQGGNTGLCEGAVPDLSGNEVVLSLARMNRLRHIDPVNFTMTVEAGMVLQTIQERADEAGCFFPLSLGAQGSCQIGGNISTNAGGVGVLRYGSARALVLGLEVVLADGTVWDGLKSLGKDNTGYDLKQFFIGAEGTLGVITAAVLKMFPKPQDVQTAFCGLPDLESALPLLARARAWSGDQITAFELMPRQGVEFAMRYLPGVQDPLAAPHDWYALVDLATSRPGGDLRETMESLLAEAMEAGVVTDAVIAASSAQRKALWRIREEMPEANRRSGAVLHHDVAVPTSQVPAYIRRVSASVAAARPGVRLVPFGHLGDGNIHFSICQPVGADPEAFYRQGDELTRMVFDIAMEMRGSFSAEHGIGRLKLDELARYKNPADLLLMRRIKAALDPRGLMNPGKVVAAAG